MRYLFVFFLLLSSCNTRRPESFSPEYLMRGIAWPNPPQEMSVEEAKCLLNQPFTHLGYGTQAVAFLGSDGKTVLKFLLQKNLKGEKRFSLPSIRRILFASERKEIKRKRSMEVLRRYAAAYRDLRDETGILFTHLTPQEEDFGSVTVTGIDGKIHRLTLIDLPFILQKKAETVGERVQKVRGKREEEKALFVAIQDLLKRRARKGYHDRRRRSSFILFYNYGLIGDKAIMLDPGNLEYSETQMQNPDEEIASLNRRFENWKLEHFER